MKSQIITDEIRKAIHSWYMKENLTYRDIAKIIGIGSSSVGFWMNGQADSIRPKNWAILYHHIKSYLPDNYSASKVPEPARSDHAELTSVQIELLALARKMSLSDQYKVLSYAAELLEKSGADLQSKVLGS